MGILEHNQRKYVSYEDYLSLEQKYQEAYVDLAEKYKLLQEQLARLNKLAFGSQSEKRSLLDPNQTRLFELPTEAPAEEQTQEIRYKRTKPNKDKKPPVRASIPDDLPRVDEWIEPDFIPEGAVKIGEEVTEVLEMDAPRLYVRRIIRPKYAVPKHPDQGIVCAQLPELPLPRSNAGASLLAYLIVSKYVDHLPFHRIGKMLKRQNMNLAESTLSGWFSKVADLIEPMYDKLKSQALSQHYLMADETPIKVLDRDKKQATHRGYYWAYYDPLGKIALFEYRPSRGREGPNDFLQDYRGILQTDGYNVYDHLRQKEHITHAACMAHARRKFYEARRHDPDRANKAMDFIGKLYAIEKKLRQGHYTDAQILQERKQAQSILSEFKEWMTQELYGKKVLPKSTMGLAIAYTLKLYDKLWVYTEHPQMNIDNNPIENSIRPIAVGRKNYLFAGSHNAAQKAAMIYSLMATCKINDVNPMAWLKKVLETLNETKASQLQTLFPQNLSLD